MNQSGHFCIFTEEFLLSAKSGVKLDELPIFQAGGYPVFQIADEEQAEIDAIFRKMHRELASGYVYKYDLLRNYVLELRSTSDRSCSPRLRCAPATTPLPGSPPCLLSCWSDSSR